MSYQVVYDNEKQNANLDGNALVNLRIQLTLREGAMEELILEIIFMIIDVMTNGL